MRTDCTQVVLGLLTDTNGIPLCFEVHPGVTFEGNTLSDIVEKMEKKRQKVMMEEENVPEKEPNMEKEMNE